MTDWQLSESAIIRSQTMGVSREEIIATCEQPDWVYVSEVYAGANVAIGGRLAVAHDLSSLLVLNVSWREKLQRRPSGE